LHLVCGGHGDRARPRAPHHHCPTSHVTAASGPAPSSTHRPTLHRRAGPRATLSNVPPPTTKPHHNSGAVRQLPGLLPGRVVWLPRSARCRSFRQGRCRRQSAAASRSVYVRGAARQGLEALFWRDPPPESERGGESGQRALAVSNHGCIPGPRSSTTPSTPTPWLSQPLPSCWHLNRLLGSRISYLSVRQETVRLRKEQR
jgi:hypothetical protein